MIQKKHELQEEAKLRNQEYLDREEHLKNIQDYIRVADSMRTFFISKEKKKMWLYDITEMI